jgi:hypothetical protein
MFSGAASCDRAGVVSLDGTMYQFLENKIDKSSLIPPPSYRFWWDVQPLCGLKVLVIKLKIFSWGFKD